MTHTVRNALALSLLVAGAVAFFPYAASVLSENWLHRHSGIDHLGFLRLTPSRMGQIFLFLSVALFPGFLALLRAKERGASLGRVFLKSVWVVLALLLLTAVVLFSAGATGRGSREGGAGLALVIIGFSVAGIVLAWLCSYGLLAMALAVAPARAVVRSLAALLLLVAVADVAALGSLGGCRRSDSECVANISAARERVECLPLDGRCVGFLAALRLDREHCKSDLICLHQYGVVVHDPEACRRLEEPHWRSDCCEKVYAVVDTQTALSTEEAQSCGIDAVAEPRGSRRSDPATVSQALEGLAAADLRTRELAAITLGRTGSREFVEAILRSFETFPGRGYGHRFALWRLTGEDHGLNAASWRR